MMLLGWATIPFVLPFTILSFVLDRYIVGYLASLLMVISIINSLNIHYRHRFRIPFWCWFLIVLSTVLFLAREIGIMALFWCYPILFSVFFIQERPRARICSAIAFVSVVTGAFLYSELEMAIRFSITLLMQIIFCDLLVGILVRLESKLTELAIRDPLTDAYNRRYMNTCLENIIEENSRNFGSASLLLIDIDHFKQINDEVGHIAGDTVIKNLVDLLNQRKRKIDFVFRVGGEEFVVLLKNTALQQAVLVAESLRQNIERTELIEGRNVTISVGVAELNKNETDDEWLQRADENLYIAKRYGRNCVRPIIDNN